jgi:hypothetical protein
MSVIVQNTSANPVPVTVGSTTGVSDVLVTNTTANTVPVSLAAVSSVLVTNTSANTIPVSLATSPPVLVNNTKFEPVPFVDPFSSLSGCLGVYLASGTQSIILASTAATVSITPFPNIATYLLSNQAVEVTLTAQCSFGATVAGLFYDAIFEIAEESTIGSNLSTITGATPNQGFSLERVTSAAAYHGPAITTSYILPFAASTPTVGLTLSASMKYAVQNGFVLIFMTTVGSAGVLLNVSWSVQARVFPQITDV